MTHTKSFSKLALLCSLLLLPVIADAQVTRADYERAAGLRRKYDGLAVNIVDWPTWIGKTNHFWYRKSVKGGNEFVLVDAETLTKKAAFDHERLAASLSSATGKKYTAITLPFMALTFVDMNRELSSWPKLRGGGAACRITTARTADPRKVDSGS